MSTRQTIDWTAIRTRLEQNQATIDQGFAVPDANRLQQLYRDRARQFAARATAIAKATDTWPALVFTVGAERFCLATAEVAEVLRCAKCSRIPGARPELLGVVNVRGRICSVLDLARVFELPPTGEASSGYIVLVRHADVEVGLKVDDVQQVERISRDVQANVEPGASGSDGVVVLGRTAGRATILNMEYILARYHGRAPGEPTNSARPAPS